MECIIAIDCFSSKLSKLNYKSGRSVVLLSEGALQVVDNTDGEKKNHFKVLWKVTCNELVLNGNSVMVLLVSQLVSLGGATFNWGMALDPQPVGISSS